MKSVYCIIHTEYDEGQTYDDVLEECFLTAEQAKAFALKASEVAFDTDYEDCPFSKGGSKMRTDDVRVGMKVRIKDHWVSRFYNHDGKMDHWLGQTMTVAHIDSFTNDIKMIEDADENNGYGWYWCADDFDPVIETDCQGGSKMKYQIGEVVRIHETGALATVIGIDDDGLPIGYLTVADEKTAWYKESSLEPVNGGMPKPTEESTSDSLSLEQLIAKFRTMDVDIFEQVFQAMEVESQRRDEQQRRQLAGAIASAMEVYLRKVGDNRDFYSRGGEYMSMQDMHDAIVNEFDLTAS